MKRPDGLTVGAVISLLVAGAMGLKGTGGHLTTGTGVIDTDTARVTMATDDTVATNLTNIAADTNSLAVVGNGAAATAQRVTLANDSTGQVAVINSQGNPAQVEIGDGTETALVTAAGELNVIATAQPGVDVGDVTINNAAGAAAVNIQDGGNIITVDGTVDTELPAAAALADGTANPTSPIVGAAGLLFNDGGSWDRASGDTTGAYVQGPTAADGPIAARPLTVGGRASTAVPAAVSADGDVVNAWHTRRGAAVTTAGVTAYVMSSTFAANLQAQAANTGLRLVLVTVQETAGATAQLYVIHGTLESDTRLVPVRLAANESVVIHLPGGISADSGVFLDWVSGAMSVTVGTEDHE